MTQPDRTATITARAALEPARLRARYLTQALELEEHNAPLVVPLGVLATAALVIGTVVWSAYTEVPEVAMATGTVVPQGESQPVQHLEGGIVESLLVRNGDRVESGQLLATLAAAPAESENLQIDARSTGLRLRIARLQAQIAGTRELHLDRADVDQEPQLAEREQALFEETHQSRQAQLEVLSFQGVRFGAEAEGVGRQIAALREEVGALERKQAMYASGQQAQVVPRGELLDLDARLARTRADLQQLETQRSSSQNSAGEAAIKVEEFTRRMREEDYTKLEEASQQLSELEAQTPRSLDRVQRLELRSPVTGIVQALALKGAGEVIEPGGTLLEIVPENVPLQVEARVSTVDVGHVHPGQLVDVRVHSYEPERFGTVSGELLMVSASTYLDELQQPYYKAKVALAQNHVGNDPKRSPLMAGMTVDAQIILGKKTILDYLLAPVYRGINQAFRER